MKSIFKNTLITFSAFLLIQSCLDEDICTPDSIPSLTFELRNIDNPDEIFIDTIYYNQYYGKKTDGTDSLQYTTFRKLTGNSFTIPFYQTSNKDVELVIYRRSDRNRYAIDANGNRIEAEDGTDSISGIERTRRDTISFTYDLGDKFENSSCGAKVIFNNINYTNFPENYWIKELTPITTEITDATTVNLHIKTSIFRNNTDYVCAECPE